MSKTVNSIGMKRASPVNGFTTPSNFSHYEVENSRNNMTSSTSSATKPGGVTSTKKLVLNFKSRPKRLADNFFDESWIKLEAAVKAIFDKTSISTSQEDLYKAVDCLCNNNQSILLFKKLKTIYENHLMSCLPTFTGEMEGFDSFLTKLDKCWHNHCTQINMIRNIFLCLDRNYIQHKNTALSNTSEMMCLWDMGLMLFRTLIIESEIVSHRVRAGILYRILQDREGNYINKMELKSIIQMLCDLGLYTEVFERAFLRETKDFYERESQKLSRDLQIPSYLAHAEKRLLEEGERIKLYLHKTSLKQLIRISEEALIRSHIKHILVTGFTHMIHQNEIDNLSRLYRLLFRVTDGLTELDSSFREYILSTGRSFMIPSGPVTLNYTPTRDDLRVVPDIIVFKDNLDTVIQNAFDGNERFATALRESFVLFLNKVDRPRERWLPQLLAKFVDAKLKAGNKEATDEELDKVLDKTMTIFRFIDSKDVFKQFFTKHLSKRLLLNTSASVDTERVFLSKLKEECGYTFTCQMENMFKDVEVSKQFNENFKEMIRQSSTFTPTIDLNVQVLSCNSWPTSNEVKSSMPSFMQAHLKEFKEYYNSKFQGRRLDFKYTEDTCTLKCNLPMSSKELHVSLHQALVLLLFNDADTLTFEEIKEKTGIVNNDKGLDARRDPDRELKRTLQSLACGKVRLINKIPKGRDISTTDKFAFNSSFKDPRRRIKVNKVQERETEGETEKVNEDVDRNREGVVEAAIVRIMKMRKTLTHQELLGQVMEQLTSQFRSEPQFIKKHIEALIAKVYLKRDTENRTVYHYVA